MDRHVSDTLASRPMRRAPTVGSCTLDGLSCHLTHLALYQAQIRSRRSKAIQPMRPTPPPSPRLMPVRPKPPPSPRLMPVLPRHHIVAHPSIDDFDEPRAFAPTRTRTRNIGNPMPSQQPWNQTPNVAMMQMQIQQQQQQLLLQQQQLAIMQMQRDMERQTAETRARLLREPISVRDRSARLYEHSPISYRRRSPLPSPRDRTARRRAPRARSPRHAASPRHDTAMRVVLSIEDVQLEEAIKCALIVRLAPGSKGRVDGVSNVDFQPQKTEVTLHDLCHHGWYSVSTPERLHACNLIISLLRR